MMEMIPAVKYKVCMLAPDHKYQGIEESLSLFIGPCTFEREIYPFMLRHRDFDIYVLDMSTSPFAGMRTQFEQLHHFIKSHRASVFAIWDRATWNELNLFSSGVALNINVAFCDTPDWCEAILCAIHHVTRLYSNERS